MADIKYIAFDFIEENNNEISPENVEVEIIANDQYIITQYKFDNTLYNLFPEFNEGYIYDYEDVVEDNITTRTIHSNKLPTLMKFGDTETDTDRTRSLLEILYMDINNLNDLVATFMNCKCLLRVDTTNFNTSHIYSMQAMFCNCESLTSIDISNFDTSGVRIMTTVFYNCRSLTSLDVSEWNVDNVNNMNYMFYGCEQLSSLDLSKWNVDNVTDMSYMFDNCYMLTTLNVTGWNTAKVTTMRSMFDNCTSLVAIEGVNNWETGEVLDMYALFGSCEVLQSLDLSNWNTAKVTTMRNMFDNCTSLVAIEGVNNWETHSVTDVSYMFYHCKALKSLDLSGWDTGNVTDMEYMFARCYELNSIIGIENLNVSKVTSMDSMFFHSKLSELDLSNWKTDSLTDLDWIFCDCYMLRTLNVTGWNTSKLTQIVEAFAYSERGCHNLLEIIGLNTWDVSNITRFEDLFWECRSLKSLDLSGWDMRNATYINWMFCDCESLESLKLNDWHLNENVQYEDMFSSYEYSGCPLLASIEMNDSDYSSINKIISALPIRTANSPGILDITGVDDLSQIDIVTAESQYWNIVQKQMIAQYRFDANRYENLLPEFNAEFTADKYRVIDDVHEYVIDEFGWIENYDYYYEKNRNELIYREGYKISRNIPCIENSTYIFQSSVNIFWFDKDDNCISLTMHVPEDVYPKYVIAPANAAKFRVNRYITNEKDLTITQKLVNRTIYSEELPTMIKFGEENSLPTDKQFCLLSVDYINTGNMNYMIGMFSGCKNVTYINASDWNTSRITGMAYVFNNCQQLTELDVSNWDTSKVTNNMYYMFNNCYSLKSLDVSNWDVSKVGSSETTYKLAMECMFFNCESLTTLDVSNWDTKNVTNMSCMFDSCTSLTSLDVSNWDTSNVTDMSYMFNNCSNLTSLDVSNWNTSDVINMSHMFNNCSNLTSLDVSNWGTSNVTDMGYMFYNCQSLTSLDVSNWDTSNMISLGATFQYCIKLTSLDVSNWDTSSVINIHALFNNTALTTININKFDLSKLEINSDAGTYIFSSDNAASTHSKALKTVYFTDNDITAVDYRGMFINRSNLKYIQCNNINNLPVLIEQLPVRDAADPGVFVTNAEYTAEMNAALVAKNWNFIRVEDIENVIVQYKFDTNIHRNLIPVFNPEFTGYFWNDVIEDEANPNIVTRTIRGLSGLPTFISFAGNTSLIECGYINLTNVNALSDCFQGCSSLIKIDSTNWNTSNITKIDTMFHLCSSLTEIIGIEDWDTSSFGSNGETRAITAPFANCTSLTKLDLSKWVIDYDVSANSMFTTCTNLVEISLPKFNGKINILGMFMLCPNLKEIKGLENIKVLSPGSNRRTFEGCSSLEYVNMQRLDASAATRLDIMFSDCSSLIEIDFSNAKFSEDVVLTSLFYNCGSLQRINLTNVNNVSFINKVIAQLPTRLIDNPGALNITNDLSQVDVATAESKYWNIIQSEPYKIAEYKFDSSLYDLFPEFNTGYTYTYKDIIEGNVTTRTIYSDELPTLIKFGRPYGSNLNDETNRVSSLLEVISMDTSNVTTMQNMFCGCLNLVKVNATNWDTSSVTNMAHMFGRNGTGEVNPGCESLEKIIGIEDWDTSNVTNMEWMFYGAYKLEALDLSKWNTSKVWNMAIMFCAAGWDNPNFSLNIKDWDVSKVQTMTYMFDCCVTLKELDLSGWDVSLVYDMNWMFGNDDQDDLMSLTKLNLSGWKFNNAVIMNNFFSYANKLNEIIMNNSDYASVNKLISILPTRTIDNKGTLDIKGVDDLSQVDIATAESKYWNIEYVVSEKKSCFMFMGEPVNIKFLGEDKTFVIFIGDNQIF